MGHRGRPAAPRQRLRTATSLKCDTCASQSGLSMTSEVWTESDADPWPACVHALYCMTVPFRKIYFKTLVSICLLESRNKRG